MGTVALFWSTRNTTCALTKHCRMG